MKKQLPDNQMATLHALRDTSPGGKQMRGKELRAKTGIHIIGLPKLVKAGLVNERR